jgi:hypothetical protein
VLKDRDAYILFYARDDSGGTPRRSEEMDIVSEHFLTPLQTKKPANGLSETSRLSSSGQKRSFNEDRTTESPSKRPRLSDDEDSHPKSKMAKDAKSREPLKTVTNGFISPASLQTAEPVSWKSLQPPNVQRPNPPSKLPPQSPLSKSDIPRPEKNIQFSKDPTRQRSGKPNHKITPLLTTDANPYADTDPFAAGVYLGQQRQSEKQKSHGIRPKYPGIGSQLVPGSNRDFMRTEKTLAQRSDLGIRLNKNRPTR